MLLSRPFPPGRAVAAGVTFLAAAVALASDSTGLIPLSDMQPNQPYKSFPGGLYPDIANYVSGRHLAHGLHLAQQIRPLNTAGQPAANGRIVLLTIGMSNTSQESTQFVTLANAFADRNPAVVVVNGAQGGQTAAIISDPSAQFWTVIDQRLAQQGLTAAQVQTVWYKEANASPTGDDIAYAQTLREQHEAIMQIIRARYANCRIVYGSSRTYGGYAETALNPEPYAYVSGFSVKWLIQDQIAGDPGLTYGAGGVSPWLQWGPYLWADGLTPRSDGLTWVRDDFGADGTHPSAQGALKVGNMLLSFFATAPTARLWFLQPGLGVLLGDMNGDGRIDGFDVDPFVLALIDPAAFAVQYPDVDPVAAGDLNQDGELNGFDVGPFAELLIAY